MTLKEKFQEWHNEVANPTIEEDVNDLEKIADEFAIGFAEWLVTFNYEIDCSTSKELLEIYKTEKGL
jgi:hypothetical protein